MSGLRIAGAPISWGVCEVPDWGHQLAPDRVLREMRQSGLTATEIGPDGFLPSEPAAMAQTLQSHDLTAVGGFVPVLLHESGHDPVPGTLATLDGFVAAGAEVVVLAAVTGTDGYDSRPELSDDAWKCLFTNLDRLRDVAESHGLRAVLHPHVGTVVEQRSEVMRVLDGSSIPLCLDTGHLMIGGTDPLDLAAEFADRITHAHLKDVDTQLAERVQAGELTYTEGVAQGMYRPLGRGDVDIAGVVKHLRSNGYDGWFVLEQDTILAEEPAGRGPVVDVETSVAYLNSIA